MLEICQYSEYNSPKISACIFWLRNNKFSSSVLLNQKTIYQTKFNLHRAEGNQEMWWLMVGLPSKNQTKILFIGLQHAQEGGWGGQGLVYLIEIFCVGCIIYTWLDIETTLPDYFSLLSSSFPKYLLFPVLCFYSNMRPFVKRFHTEFNLTLKSSSCKKFQIISLR